MTTIASDAATGGISIAKVKRLDASLAVQLSAEKTQALQAHLREMQEMQYRRPVGPPDEVYAEVKVGGKVVATLYNSGCAVTGNATAGKLSKLPSMGEGCTLTGPALAQLRAEEIAKALGGKVEKAGSALTQAQWKALPPTTWVIDHAAMARDEAAAAAAQRNSARTLIDVQLLAGSDA